MDDRHGEVPYPRVPTVLEGMTSRGVVALRDVDYLTFLYGRRLFALATRAANVVDVRLDAERASAEGGPAGAVGVNALRGEHGQCRAVVGTIEAVELTVLDGQGQRTRAISTGERGDCG